MGVQDFNPVVQHLVNRVQPFEVTEELTRAARDLGITFVRRERGHVIERDGERIDEARVLHAQRLGLGIHCFEEGGQAAFIGATDGLGRTVRPDWDRILDPLHLDSTYIPGTEPVPVRPLPGYFDTDNDGDEENVETDGTWPAS